MTSTASLRDLYHVPSSSWSFTPPPGAPQNVSPPAPAPPPTPPSSYQWSTRPAYNSVLDLSPSLDLSEPYTIDAVLLVKSLVASAVLQYTSTAIAMPWEVGKMLLQVQWVPRNAVLPEQIPEEGEEEEEIVSSSN
jgi:fusion and transport protein UGO1